MQQQEATRGGADQLAAAPTDKIVGPRERVAGEVWSERGRGLGDLGFQGDWVSK